MIGSMENIITSSIGGSLPTPSPNGIMRGAREGCIVLEIGDLISMRMVTRGKKDRKTFA